MVIQSMTWLWTMTVVAKRVPSVPLNIIHPTRIAAKATRASARVRNARRYWLLWFPWNR